MRLKYQLFITLLLSSIALLAMMAVLNSVSFDRGFAQYFVKNELTRISPLIDELTERYAAEGNWDWLTATPDAKRIVDHYYDRPRPQKSNNRDSNQRGGNNRRTVRQKPYLVDENRELLLGREIPRNHVFWQPIVLESRTIGYLGIREPKALPGELEEAFVAQQLRNYMLAAGGLVVLSALMAFGLAYRMVKPIEKLNAAVSHITAGEYKQRIETKAQDEIGDLSRSINQMANTLDKNRSARQQWMAEMSHELRTPVAVLQGELEAIQDGVNDLDENAIHSLHTETLRLARLINDLHDLTLSDLGAMDFKMVTVDFAELIRERLDVGKLALNQANLSVIVEGIDTEVLIQADAQRLSQLIDNLLQNSIRYTDDPGTLRIQLTHQKDTTTLSWNDSAPGVNTDQLPKLFEPLFRGELSRNRASGGSGLGLAIAQKVAEAHQGSIVAKHSDLGGLSIQLTLPLQHH